MKHPVQYMYTRIIHHVSRPFISITRRVRVCVFTLSHGQSLTDKDIIDGGGADNHRRHHHRRRRSSIVNGIIYSGIFFPHFHFYSFFLFRLSPNFVVYHNTHTHTQSHRWRRRLTTTEVCNQGGEGFPPNDNYFP